MTLHSRPPSYQSRWPLEELKAVRIDKRYEACDVWRVEVMAICYTASEYGDVATVRLCQRMRQSHSTERRVRRHRWSHELKQRRVAGARQNTVSQ